MIQAGVNKANGFTTSDARQLRVIGASIADLQQGGWSVKDLLQAGFSEEAFARAGYATSDLIAAALADGATIRQMHDEFGFSCATLLRQSQGTITYDGMRGAGFSAAAIIQDGVNRSGGWTVKELAQSYGCTLTDLLLAGYSKEEIIRTLNKNNGYSLGFLQRSGFSDEDIEAAGYSMSAKDKERRAKAEANRKQRNAMLSSVTEVPFKLRPPPAELPFRAEDITLDVVIVMDCTGSMVSTSSIAPLVLFNAVYPTA